MPEKISSNLQRKVLELAADITQAQFDLNFFSLKLSALEKMVANIPKGKKEARIHYKELVSRVGTFRGVYSPWTKSTIESILFHHGMLISLQGQLVFVLDPADAKIQHLTDETKFYESTHQVALYRLPIMERNELVFKCYNINCPCELRAKVSPSN